MVGEIKIKLSGSFSLESPAPASHWPNSTGSHGGEAPDLVSIHQPPGPPAEGSRVGSGFHC